MEMSYNLKNSPKKLFAETSKKNNYLRSQYKNTITNKNTNGYLACFTEDNEARIPNLEDKIDKSFKKIVVSFQSLLKNYFKINFYVN